MSLPQNFGGKISLKSLMSLYDYLVFLLLNSFEKVNT